MAKFNGFNGDYSGLTDDAARMLQLQFGKNELVPPERNTFLSKILAIFKEPMFLLLFCTAFLYFLLGEPRDGIIMLCFVTFMSGINMFQEWRTDRTLQALKELSAPKVRVIRNGLISTMESTGLVPGDLLLLSEGDRIAADGMIIEMFDLGVDESSLTGESDVVWKKAGPAAAESDSHWRSDMCYAGTAVTQGSAIVEVSATGRNTEYGRIGQDILAVPQQPTPLERQTRRLIRVSAFVGLALFFLVFFVTLAHSFNLIESMLSGISLAMAMIPEEFPVILTVFLAMGAWRLARKKSLIRRMPSVETLGAVSVLCVDKTGTLTKNQMAVQEIYCHDRNDKNSLISWSVLACETEPYDPMEKAIHKFARSCGINAGELYDKALLYEYPFSSEAKMMGHVWEIDGVPSLAAKGSPESILPLCCLDEKTAAELRSRQEQLALKGYRVIAVAVCRRLSSIPKELTKCRLELIGLIGLADPPRENVPEAVKICSKAGIRVIMITGDNGLTAKAIAKKIGLKNSDNIVTGQQLESMTDEELLEEIKTTGIFARVIPRHKLRIVKALKEAGEIVAMTGDGVNDAPALKYADIGVAMGGRGTGVAKEAADMILLDDNFTTIVDTIKDGRRIYDNIKKAIGYVFVIHIPIALSALFSPLLHLPLLLLPVHIVLLELIIDPTCSIVFERQPSESDIMDRKPRTPDEPLVSRGLMLKSALQGLSIYLASFGSYIYFINQGWTVEAARTFTLIVLGFANLFLVYVNQSDRGLALAGIFKFRDKVIWYVNAGIILVLAAAIYLPAGAGIAKTVPLDAFRVISAIALAALSTFWWEAVKVLQACRKSGSLVRKLP